MKRVVAVIPARMGASRFPGKPLARILDLPMIEHVRRRTCLADSVDEVVVATCDNEIVHTVQDFGGKAVMTATTHERCTDRVNEAIQNIPCDIVVIVQGDEPLFNPSTLDEVVSPLHQDNDVYCTNLVSVIRHDKEHHDVDNVKAVLDGRHNVLYYSRLPIPYLRVHSNPSLYRQTGISAFSKGFLSVISALPQTDLEVAESIDFLRILGHGYTIRGVICDDTLLGVDQPDDVPVIEKILSEDATQKKYYDRIKVL